MCGIAGWINYSGSRNLLNEDQKMSVLSGKLAPRGPDDSGIFKTEECYFVHRRLVVIDPENGRQPMTRGRAGQNFTICYNGELYNTDDVRGKLTARGHSFTGHSDTEVLLKAYIEWGDDCVDELNGIYAFAVWDSRRHRLFLARDRIGVKPLFFSLTDGGAGLLFASELKALLSHPDIKPVLDSGGAAQIALLGPARRGGSGVFKNILELLPGECASFSKEDGLRRRTYWRLKAAPHTENFEDSAEHVKSLLFDAIERQLVSDVPLCTFLSGGLDSSIISAVAAKHFAARGERLNTYSVDYKGNRENFVKSLFQPDEDAPHIKIMSDFLGSNHRNVVVDTPELVAALFPAAAARDLPGMADVDSSLYLFCRAVKADFAVAVSGECADEPGFACCNRLDNRIYYML